MTEQEAEEFNAVAYSYRSWPTTDQAGVVARFEELRAFVEQLIERREPDPEC